MVKTLRADLHKNLVPPSKQKLEGILKRIQKHTIDSSGRTRQELAEKSIKCAKKALNTSDLSVKTIDACIDNLEKFLTLGIELKR